MQLYHPDGRAVKPGDEVTSFRGEKYIVAGWPKNGRNRVWVREPGAPHTASSEREFFPTVFNLRWEP